MKPPPEDLLWHHCRAGHDGHKRQTVRHNLGSYITIYDWRRYMVGSDVYCTGQDVISQTIEQTGVWEPGETAVFVDLLGRGEPGLVLDLGCQIGWYSHLAGAAQHPVWMVDVSAENLELALLNTEMSVSARGVEPGADVTGTLGVIDGDIESFDDPVKIAKIDIEGSERHAIQMLAGPLSRRQVGAVLMEISPVFNDTYPAIMEQMQEWGYDWWPIPTHCRGLTDVTAQPPLEWRDWIDTIQQADVLFMPKELA